MTEEELEVEILPRNELQVIVQNSGLEQSKAQFMLEQFTDHYKMAAEWAKKAKAIIVTDETQVVNMKMARTGHLFLREKRLEIEKARKELKESALREGKAIDMIANFLKDLIIPTEEHLERQEKFVELREKAKEDAKRAEIEKRMEEERIAEEKRLSQERERLRIENDKLRKEKEEAERQLRIKNQAEQKKEADIIRKKEELKISPDLVKIEKFYDDLITIDFPELNTIDGKALMLNCESYIGLAVVACKKYIRNNKPTIQEEEV